MNIVAITGRLGREPVTRHTNSGRAVTNFSIAVDDGFGQDKTTSWFDVTAWAKTGELAARYLHKGSKVGVTGRLTSRSWEKDGVKKNAVEITASNIEFLDSKSAEPESQVVDDSDIPF
jgi:single-strand DNA-binding protein